MTKPIRVEHCKPCVDWWGGAKRKGRKETEVAWKVTADEVKARGYNLDFKNPHTVADDHGDPEELLAETGRGRTANRQPARPAQGHSGEGAAAMNPAQLLAHFDRISEAPDAIPRLRRFILDLAVRGKLVEQDPKDEPASELLKRIQAEKERLVKEGEIREQKPCSQVEPDEIPFECRCSWDLVRLGEAAQYGRWQSIQAQQPGQEWLPIIACRTLTTRIPCNLDGGNPGEVPR